MKSIWNWIGSRTGLNESIEACRERRVTGRVCILRSLPCMVLFAFVMQAITGIFMLMRYCPATQTAWESVYYLQYETQGGWLLRAVHHYCGQAVLVLVGLWLIGIIVRGTYRAPREFVYWTVLGLGLVTLAMLLTGDLLAWDDNSRSATLTRVGFLQAIPGVGESLFRLAAAGTEFGNLTLSQFTTLHVIVFAGAFAVLLILRAWFARRAETQDAPGAMTGATGVSPVPGEKHGQDARGTQIKRATAGSKGATAGSSSSAENVTGPYYWPNQALVNVIGCLILLAVVFGSALSHGTATPARGVALGPPADPVGFYDAARPEWAFLGLYGFSKLDMFAGGTIVPIFVIPGALVLLYFLLPFIGKARIGHVLCVLVTLFLLVGDVWLSLRVVAQDRLDEQHQQAILANRQAAERIVVLIDHNGGIPPAGALELLHSDPKTQGPILFRRHCATCHDHAGGSPEDIKAEESSAPNLYGYGSRAWLAGLLDPKRVAGPDYFGNTAFKRGQMVDFVREMFVDLEPEDAADRDLIVMALSAQAKLSSQQSLDKRDAKKIIQGNDLIGGEDGYCTDCHRFGDRGKLGTAPDLTGYASRDWLIGIIRDPAGVHYYGKNNDRMQAYGETDDQTKNLLTDREIEMLAEWLRGEWVGAVGSGQKAEGSD